MYKVVTGNCTIIRNFQFVTFPGLPAGRHGLRYYHCPGGTPNPAAAPAGGAYPSSHSRVARQEQAQRRRQDLRAAREQGVSDRIRPESD